MSQQLQPQSTETTTALLNGASDAALSSGISARPVAGLPLARVVPQDVHSMLDYAGGAAALAACFLAEAPVAKLTNAILASTATSVSLLTDYRMSVAKLVPIEVHEVVDYAWGVSNVLSPFVFGYFRKEKLASTIQVAFGLGTIAASLFTDYRAVRGVSWTATGRTSRDGAARAAAMAVANVDAR